MHSLIACMRLSFSQCVYVQDRRSYSVDGLGPAMSSVLGPAPHAADLSPLLEPLVVDFLALLSSRLSCTSSCLCNIPSSCRFLAVSSLSWNTPQHYRPPRSASSVFSGVGN